MSNIGNTKLLDDFPSTVDSFGGHTKIADAIANLIIEEKGGKSIALSGDYGSGKSTVIELLQKRLESKNNADTQYKVFTYDAWKHQQDPLRRSFIEELHSFLQRENWIDGHFENQIETLQNKREKTTNTTEPKLTKAGKIAAIATFFSPVVLIVLTYAFKNAIDPSITNSTPFWIIVTAILLLCWIVPVSALAIYWYRNANNESERNDEEDFDPFNIFIQKTYTRERKTKISFPDPTAIEFRNLFGDIVEGTLNASDRNLIIVIDNLDRMTSENGVEVWSGLLTFLNQQNLKQFDAKENIWVLVPFNFDNLKDIWEESAPTDVQKFIDKTFQVVYRIAKPVMIDWKRFLEDNLKEAFPKITEDESHRIYRLFQIIYVQKQKNGLPTPREIIRFVNDLSGLFRRWKQEIPLVVLAFYNLISEKLNEVDDKHKKINEFDKTHIVTLLENKEWIKYTFAVHYNVTPDKAYHVLLSEPIQRALESGGDKKIVELSQNQGFYEVLEEVIQDLNPKEINIFSNTLIALNELGEPEFQSHINIWKVLGAKYQNLDQINALNEPVGEGIKILLIQRKQVRGSLAQKTIDLFSDFNQESIDKTAVENWGESIFEVLSYLNGIEKLKDISHNLTVPFDADNYIVLLSHLSSNNYEKKLFQFLKTDISSGDIVTKLKDKIKQDNFDYADAVIFPYINEIENFNNIEWDSYISESVNKLTPNSSLNKDQFGSIIESLLYIHTVYKNAESSGTYTSTTVTNNVFHWLHSYKNDEKCTSRAILFQLLINPGLNFQTQSNTQNGKNHTVQFLKNPNENKLVLKKFGAITKNLNAVDNMLNVYKEYDYTAIYKMLNLLCEEGDFHKYINPHSIISEFATWEKALSGNNLDRLIKDQIRFNDLVSNLISEEVFKPENHKLLDISVRYAEKENDKPRLITHITRKVDELSTDEWYNIIVDETRLFELLEYLDQLNQFPSLSEAFDEAFKRYNIDLCNNDLSSHSKNNDLKLIAVNYYGKRDLVNLLINILNDSASDNTTSFLKTYKMNGLILGSAIFVEKSDLLLKTIFPHMLNSITNYELKWIKKAFDQTSIYDECSLAAKRHFNDRIRKEFFEGGHSNEINTLLESISEAAGFDLDNTEKYEKE